MYLLDEVAIIYKLDLIRCFNGYRHYYDKHNMMGLTTRSGLKVKVLYKDEPFSFMLEHKKTSLLTSSQEKLFLWICNTSVVMDTTTRYTVAWKCFLIHLKWHKRKNKWGLLHSAVVHHQRRRFPLTSRASKIVWNKAYTHTALPARLISELIIQEYRGKSSKLFFKLIGEESYTNTYLNWNIMINLGMIHIKLLGLKHVQLCKITLNTYLLWPFELGKKSGVSEVLKVYIEVFPVQVLFPAEFKPRHPVRNQVAIKVNFTEKAMAELKSLGKRLQE